MNLIFSTTTLTLLLLLSSTFITSVFAARTCADLPVRTSPAVLFSFCPITSTQTATFDFFLASKVTAPHGMQSGYATKISAGQPLQLTQNFWWSGTLGILDKLVAYEPGSSTAFCEFNVTPLFRQTRYGVLKTDVDLLDTHIDIPFSPNYVPTANSAFNFVLHGDPMQNYTALIAAGWKIGVAFSQHRACDAAAHPAFQWINVGDEVSATIVNVTALRWTMASGVPSSIYSVCIKITDSSAVTSGWFPLAAANGHYRNNLVVGSIATGPVAFWNTQNPLVLDSGAFIFFEVSLVGTPYNRFLIDTTLDVCNPLLSPTPAFLRARFANWNASFKAITDTVTTPPMNPGGGSAIICGALNDNSPWMLISANPLPATRCAAGEGFIDGACFTCDCNTAGVCNDVMTIDYTSKSAACSCFPGFAGNNCQFADLPQPSSSIANNTQLPSRHTPVTFTAADPSWTVHYEWLDNGSLGNCTSACTIMLPATKRHVSSVFKLRLWTSSSNGSSTFENRRPAFVLKMLAPTLSDTESHSQTITVTQTVTPAPTPTRTHSQSSTPPPTRTASFTRTLQVSYTRIKTASSSAEQTDTRSRWIMDRAICAAALNATRATLQFPDNSTDFSFTEAMRCGMCTAVECSWGFTSSCRGPDALGIDMSFMSLYPTPHCNVSFYDSVSNSLINITLPIVLLPTAMTARNLWIPDSRAVSSSGAPLRTSSTLSVALVNYSFAPPGIPFSVANTKMQIRVCEQEIWKELAFPGSSTSAEQSLTTLTLPPSATRSSACLEVQIASVPLQTTRYNFTVVFGDALAEADNATGGFVKGGAADILVQVGDGAYQPPTQLDPASGASSVSVELASAFQGGSSSSSSSDASSSSSSSFPAASQVVLGGIKNISDLTAATWAVLASSILVGAGIIFALYNGFKPKSRDNVANVVNAMIGPAEKMSQ